MAPQDLLSQIPPARPHGRHRAVRPRAAFALLALAGAGCVFPNLEPTGIEVAWRFVEGNGADGEAARRTRTCAGARASTVRVAVTDANDATRTGTFTYDCEVGFETLESLQVDPSEVFLSLRAGTYEVELDAVSDPGVAFASDMSEIEVARKAVTLHAPALTLPVVPWTLRLTGADSCGEASLRLVYRDADAALVEGEAGGSSGSAGGTGAGASTGGSSTGGGSGAGTGGGGNLEGGVLYRSELVSATGLDLDGTPMACASLSGEHPFMDVDVGDYALEISVDGSPACSLALRVDRPDLAVEIDLANLPCAG